MPAPAYPTRPEEVRPVTRWAWIGVLAALPALALGACAGGGNELILATTTSTQDSGLLDVLVPEVEKGSDYNVQVIAVGTGEALAMGERGDADLLLVHAPSSETELVESGAAINRRLVMHNDFVIVGPEDDPGGIQGMTSAVEALAAIYDSGATFISGGDDAGA